MVDPEALRDVFDRAVRLPQVHRAEFLDRACGSDAELRTQVDRLLWGHDRAGSVLEAQDSNGCGSPSDTPNDSARAALAPGTRLGPYAILAPVGAGGMGDVYKACDTRLERTVAIKVLPPGMTANPAARRRLEREARAAAALAHPHICTLLDIGRQDDVDFLVLEFLDGDTLETCLARGRLSLIDVVTYAIDIAEALDAAHSAGIVHRDLKPGNVMLTKSGTKLLDFGLAKRGEPVLAAEAVRSGTITQAGTIVGTVHYMAPEQLEGQAVDARADMFAFGAVLYEMLAGRRAFGGSSGAAVIGNILHGEPPALSSINPLMPPGLEEIVSGCLAKDPGARWQAMSLVQARLEVVREALRNPEATNSETRDRIQSSARSLHGLRNDHLVALGATGALVLVVVSGIGWWTWSREPAPSRSESAAPVQRNLTRLTFDAGLQTDVTFSPDGRFIAYASGKAGNFDIWVQPIAGGDAVQVTKSPAVDVQPSWSPDGSTIAFRSERDDGGLYLVPALGGDERRLAGFGVHPSWSADGREVRFLTPAFIGGGAKLYSVSTTGEPPSQILPEFTANGRWRWIGAHPDGRFSFIGLHGKLGFGFFTVSRDGQVTDSNVVHRVPDALQDMVHGGGRRFAWNRQGTALTLETETSTGVENLWRVRVDPSTLEWRSVDRLTTGAGSDVAAALSPDGERLAFSTTRVSDRLWRFALKPVGHRLSNGQPVTEEGSTVLGSEISPDGDMAVNTVTRAGSEGTGGGRGLGTLNLWLLHLDSARSELFSANAQSPVWSPDRQRIAYTKLRPEAIDRKSGSLSTALAVATLDRAERLITPWGRESAIFTVATDWLPDGGAVLACDGARVIVWPVSDPPATAPSRVVLARADMRFRYARHSPGRRWLAFLANPSGRPGVSVLGVTSADGLPDRAWIPVAPTHEAVHGFAWAPDGKVLYFLTSESGSFIDLWRVQFDPRRGTPVGEPASLTHLDSPGFAISSNAIFWPSLNVTRDRVFLDMRTATGNIWMLDNVDR